MVSDRESTIPPARIAWDRELSAPLEDAQWTRICALVRTISSNARCKLIHFNFVNRTYVTPMTLHKMDRTKPTGCPRCKHPTASFLHLAWSCPLIFDYWSKVVGRVRTVVHIPCALEPTICLLVDIRDKKGQKVTLEFLHLLLLLAKRSVAITRMGDVAPTK